MNENVSLVPKFTSLNNSMIVLKFSDEDLEHYAEEAVKMCYYYLGTPEFYEIWDNFMELIILVGKREFYIEGHHILRGWITEETLVTLLDILRIEYISFDGTVHNECQNIIMWEWMVNNNECRNQLRTRKDDTLMLPEFHGE